MRATAVKPRLMSLFRSPPLSRVSLAAYCHKLNTFADLLLRDYDLQLAYHHHLMMLVEHDDELERFLSHTHDNVGLAFDTGHAFVAGVEIPRVLHKYGHRIRHLHLKDVRPQVLGRLYRENLSFNEAVRAGLFTIPATAASTMRRSSTLSGTATTAAG